MKIRFVLICAFVLLLAAGPFALGHWEPGEGHKMHYPQLADPFGWHLPL